MIELNLESLAVSGGGRLLGANLPFTSISTDSRTIPAGALFVALKGPSFDGHNFVDTAARRGAAGALVEKELPVAIPQVVVGDSLQALSSYARLWRRQFSVPVIGITGSNGKTTTKEMLGAISAQRGECLITQGNLNNHIGVPLTLLRLRSEHKTAVIEMGANHQGEIAALAAIAEPTVGIVTNAGAAHLEGFGGMDGVARGKGELFHALPASGAAIVNADDDYANFWRQASNARQIFTFGLNAGADFHASEIRVPTGAVGYRFEFILRTPVGERAATLSLAGEHNLRNALGAAAAAYAAGATLDEIIVGLRSMQAVSGRLRLLPAIHGASLLDDSYNANPSSLRAGIDTMCAVRGEHWLVLGDMLELGPGSADLHAQMGVYARNAGIKRLFAIGRFAQRAVESFGANAQWFENIDAMIAAVQGALTPDVTVLIKGSRANRLERVTAALSVGGAAAEHH